MTRLFLLIASFSGMTAVILGAFGAHALKQRLPANLLHSYETAVQYQFWHALALLAVVLLLLQWPASRLLQATGWLFTLGIILFSGSLYLLSLTEVRQIGAISVGPITPMGGLCFIVGWFLLILAAWQNS